MWEMNKNVYESTLMSEERQKIDNLNENVDPSLKFAK